MDSRRYQPEPYPASIRDSLIGVLELLASPAAQLAYQRDVPIADVSAELLCMWFDDSFRPDDRQLRALFTDDEWSGLLAFHAYYDTVAARLRNELPPIQELVLLPIWQDLARSATKTLDLFPDGTSTGDSPVA